MNADEQTHRQAWNDIPWLVAGSASAAQRQAFEQHAAGCADCREELAFQRQVQAAMQAGAADTTDPEPGLQRLLARMAIDEAVAPRPRRGATALRWREAGGWTRAWAAVALLQAVGLLLVLAGPWSPRASGDAAEYQTLSSPAPTSAARIRLVLAPEVSQAQLQALLQRHGLVAVEISAEAGSLGVALASGSPAVDGAVQALRREPGVRLAEPVLAPQPGRR
jgi:hypothetical protein